MKKEKFKSVEKRAAEKITIFILLIAVGFFGVTPIKKAIYPLKYEDIIVKYSKMQGSFRVSL